VTTYLTLVEALVLHRELIRRYGGKDGLRDAGALEAALFRPQSGYYTDGVHEAAALFESRAINRPFVDGNQRVAFACVDVFLRLNGYRLKPNAAAIHRWMIRQLERGTFGVETIEPFLRENTDGPEPT